MPRNQQMTLPADFPANFRAAVGAFDLYDNGEKLPVDVWCWHWIYCSWHIVKFPGLIDPGEESLHVIKMSPRGGARLSYAGGGTVSFTPKQGGVIKAMEKADARAKYLKGLHADAVPQVVPYRFDEG